MGNGDHDCRKKEGEPEQRRAWPDVGDGGASKLISEGRRSGPEIEWQPGAEGNESDSEEDGEASALDEQELSSIGAAMEGDLGGGGVVDGEELGG